MAGRRGDLGVIVADRRGRMALLPVALAWFVLWSSPSIADPPAPPPVTGSAGNGDFGVGSVQGANPGVPDDGLPAHKPVVRVIDCGPTNYEGSPLPARSTYCASVHPVCDVATIAQVPN